MTQLKTTILSIAILASVSLSGCSKEKNKEVTEEDAVEIIEASLKENSAGLSETVTKYTEALMGEFINDNCSQNYDTTYNFSYLGALIESNYTITWGYVLSCSNGLPSTINLNVTTQGTYSTNRVSSDDNSNTDFTITGLLPSATSLTYNGDITRSGSQTITINSNTREITSTINLSVSELSVNKTSYEIESGTAVATLSANNGSETFSFSGDIIFNGNGSATFTINGNSYTITM